MRFPKLDNSTSDYLVLHAQDPGISKPSNPEGAIDPFLAGIKKYNATPLRLLLLKQSQFAPNKPANVQNMYWQSACTVSLNGNFLAVVLTGNGTLPLLPKFITVTRHPQVFI